MAGRVKNPSCRLENVSEFDSHPPKKLKIVNIKILQIMMEQIISVRGSIPFCLFMGLVSGPF